MVPPDQPLTRPFFDLVKDLSPERRERIEKRKEQLRQSATPSSAG